MGTIDLEEVVYDMCCWCGRRLERDAPVVDFGATLASRDQNLERLVGCSVEIEDRGTVVTAVVSESGSDAKEAGDDILFIACSDACGDSTCAFLERLDAIRLAPLTEETVRVKMRA